MTNWAVITPRDLDGVAGFKIVGTGTQVGWGLAPLGDVNGDGKNDFVVSTAGSKSYVVYGGGTFGSLFDLDSLDGHNGFVFTTGGSATGEAVGGLDINADGLSDIVLGSVVVFGSSAGFPAVFTRALVNGSNGFVLSAGRGSAPLGDFNGDGADRADGWARTIDVGQLDGSNGFRFDGGVGSNDLGRFVEFADVNADGFDDLLISAPRMDGLTGAVFVVYGHATGPLTPFVDGKPHVDGTDLDDVVSGTLASETLNGLSGDDIFLFSGGGDQYRGDAGEDTVSYASADRGVTVRLEPDELLSGGAAAGDTFLSIERVIGSAFDDRIYGDHGRETLEGGAGNDDLRGGTGDDRLYGDAGDDRLTGEEGADTMRGGAGDDSYIVDDAGDQIVENAGEGNDRVVSTISFVLPANVEHLTILGSANLFGSGNDLENLMVGNGGDNDLRGFAGNDRLQGGEGSDKLIGGTGDDLYYVDGDDLVIELAGEGTDAVNSTTDYFLAANVENLRLVGSDALVGQGNALGNRLVGNGATNQLFGLGGDDVLDGGLGADRMVGGSGDDAYIVDNYNDRAVEEVGGGADIVFASVDYALGDHVETLRLTGNGSFYGYGNAQDNLLTGNPASNKLFGLAGNDRLVGGGGNDKLDGGSGLDRMVGGLGNDSYTIDAIGDAAIEKAGEGIDDVASSVSCQLWANVENLTLTGIADNWGRGNALENIITGNAGSNKLYGFEGDDRLLGGAGDDVLDGGAGPDRMYGGTGDDTYIVSDSTDYAYENADEGLDRVIASVTTVLRANIERLTLAGSDALNGTGNGLANVLIGNGASNGLSGLAGEDKLLGFQGDDTLQGGEGDDLLDGGAGRDRLFGGGGGDLFLLNDGDFAGLTASTCDQIKDFNGADGDRIRFDQVDANSLVAGRQEFVFIGVEAFSGSAGELRYDQINGDTYIFGDTDGDRTADFMVRLDRLHALTVESLII